MKDEWAARSLCALGNETRVKLYRTLVRAGTEGANVGTLQQVLGIPASTLAHHLSALTRAGLVIQERQGREVISRVDCPAMRELIGYLTEECCTGLRLEETADAA